jgi:hypothetical protein
MVMIGIARAKVIESDSNARVKQRAEYLLRALQILHESRFGDFDFEAVGGQPRSSRQLG